MKPQMALCELGLKWNPFIQDVPIEGLVATPRINSFVYRIETLVLDGGFAMITGEPGMGKSVLLRILEDRLSAIRDLVVCPITRPQSGLGDFYRELGAHFETPIQTSNRWGGYKSLRDRWLAHIDATQLRPVILVDEAQRMQSETMTELAHLASAQFDSRAILTVVFCGDSRLQDRFREADLFPIGTRVRTRYVAEPASREELVNLMTERLERAGNPHLMTKDLIVTLADHSAGNCRVMLNAGDELFSRAIERDLTVLDEKLFLEVFARQDQKRTTKKERTR
jgi:type II secretory pathway predicted ATPase ExeA